MSRVYGGKPDAQIRAEPEHLAKFTYQFVDAIRDAASRLFSGSNPLLRSMLEQVLDHDIESDDKIDNAAKEYAAVARRTAFRTDSKQLTEALTKRISLDAITTLVRDTGAEDGGTLRLSGSIDESDIISALRLFVERSGLSLPATFNGLGYNNLIYISLLLASLDYESDQNRLGQNAIVFPILVLEEPEAHLHPALQYKLLRFIQHRGQSRSRQVFLTTHSTHVTAAAALDSIICMSAPLQKADPRVSYPGKVFAHSPDGRSSKEYVERFLDATKSAMLFAKGVILVEGLAEQLLIPCLAECVELPLDKKHIALVAVGGSTFKHFLPLFGVGCGNGCATYALTRRVACIVDADPMRKCKGDKKARWRKCWPYQLEQETDAYGYRTHSPVVERLLEQCQGHDDKVVVKYGVKTFEYDLAFENADRGIIPASHASGDIGSELSGSLRAIENPDDRHRAEIATRYLLAVEGAKGAHAFDLASRLRDRLLETPPASPGKHDQTGRSQEDRCATVTKNNSVAVVPHYIKQAIRWACGLDEEEGIA